MSSSSSIDREAISLSSHITRLSRELEVARTLRRGPETLKDLLAQQDNYKRRLELHRERAKLARARPQPRHARRRA